MPFLNLSSMGLPISLAIFAVAAICVWLSGWRLVSYLDGISDRTGIGQAFVGMLLLGGITSLPEIAAVSSSALAGNAALATNNLLGSVAINVVLIAVGDAVLGRDAITSTIGRPVTLMQGVLVVIALAFAAAATVTGDVAVLGWIGAWPLALLIYCIFAFWLSSGYSGRAPWQSHKYDRDLRDAEGESASEKPLPHLTLSGLVLRTLAAGLMILAAGYALSISADSIATQTGLGSGLVGLVLVGFATSLPELSSITAAVRMHRYEMALGDVFGTNILTVAIIFLADVFYSDGPILNQAGPFETLGALLGLVLTGIFLVGLLERADRTVFRMGRDALAALVVFAAGLVLLYLVQS